MFVCLFVFCLRFCCVCTRSVFDVLFVLLVFSLGFPFVCVCLRCSKMVICLTAKGCSFVLFVLCWCFGGVFECVCLCLFVCCLMFCVRLLLCRVCVCLLLVLFCSVCLFFGGGDVGCVVVCFVYVCVWCVRVVCIVASF